MMIWALIALGVVLATPFYIEVLRKPMNASARQTAPGEFAALSHGTTHFQWRGPADGPMVLCIHGLTTPSLVWQSIATDLADKGFRVLAYDLYGRGFSDRPRGIQDSAFFLRQINDLLAHEKVTGKVRVIGYSMGGAIAAAFAARHPDRVSAVCLLAPAGMRAVGTGFVRWMVQTPLIGAWMMLARYPSILRRGLRAEAHLDTSVPKIGELQAAELDYRGFLPAVHASLRGMLTDDFRSEHEALREHGIPMLAIWGAEDDVIPPAAKDTLGTWNPDAAQHVITDAGHGLPYTHTPQVLALLHPWLEEHR